MATERVDGKDRGSVMLFALSTCGWCRKTKELLASLGVAYSYVYVDLLAGDELARAEQELLRYNEMNSFPTLVINDSKVIVGFRENEIREALA